MTSFVTDEVYYRDFPRQPSAKTQALWQNLALACAGVRLNEENRISEAEQQAKILGEYKGFVDSFFKTFEGFIPGKLLNIHRMIDNSV